MSETSESTPADDQDHIKQSVLRQEQGALGAYVGGRAMRTLENQGKKLTKQVTLPNGRVPLYWYIMRGNLHCVLTQAEQNGTILVRNNKLNDQVKTVLKQGIKGLDGHPQNSFQIATDMFEEQIAAGEELEPPSIAQTDAEVIRWDEIDARNTQEYIDERKNAALREALSATLERAEDPHTKALCQIKLHASDIDEFDIESIEDFAKLDEAYLTAMEGYLGDQTSSVHALHLARAEMYYKATQRLRVNLAELRRNMKEAMAFME